MKNTTKTNSEIFAIAHRIARETAAAAGSYRIAFSCALRDVYAGMYDIEKTAEEILETAGLHIWENYGKKRAYITETALENMISGHYEGSHYWFETVSGDPCSLNSRMISALLKSFYDLQSDRWFFADNCYSNYRDACEKIRAFM